ncbi:MAG: hypothetical protein II590_02575 [Clostridia bacterium]|nr:hypothetical protein [Clostridia bacterium]
MKTLRKLSALLLAVLLMLTVSFAVFAEDAPTSNEPDKTEETSTGASDTTTTGASDTTTTGADDTAATGDSEGDDAATGADDPETATETATEDPYSIGLFVTDGEGNRIQDSGAMSCLGGAVNLYIENEYILTAKYYKGTQIFDATEDKLVLGVEGGEKYITVVGNEIRLAAAPEPYTFTIKLVDNKSESGEMQFGVAVKRFKIDIPDLLVGFIGIYVIVNAITGKGSLFTDRFIKEEKKKNFKRIMRTLAAVAGIAFIAACAIGVCFSFKPWATTVRYICFGVGVAALIAMIVINNLMTDKEKRRKEQATALTGGHTSSNAAFEFDENEPTIDDVLAELDKKGPENDK